MINVIIISSFLVVIVMYAGFLMIEKKLDSMLENQKSIQKSLKRLENPPNPLATHEEISQLRTKLYNMK